MKDEGGRMKDEGRGGWDPRVWVALAACPPVPLHAPCRLNTGGRAASATRRPGFSSSFILHSSSFLALLAVALVLGLASAAHAAESISVEQLVAQKSKWPSYAASGLPMKIEGRYLIFASKLLRFMKCEDLNFVWHDEEQTFPVDLSAPRSRTIEVYGRFALDSGKPSFRVERGPRAPRGCRVAPRPPLGNPRRGGPGVVLRSEIGAGTGDVLWRL